MLTVGDGDLSYSVALLRRFGCQESPKAEADTGHALASDSSTLPRIDLTATTFPSRKEMIATYVTAEENARLLSNTEYGVKVRHCVDATALESSFKEEKFDHVIFNHPHLGLDDLHQRELHERRHRVLIAHYLYSAAKVCRIGGHIHLGLCGRQPANWQAIEAGKRIGCLDLVHNVPATRPEALYIGEFSKLRQNVPRAEWQSRKRFRHLHFMGQYGYEHRRTHGDNDIGGSGNSVDLVWRKAARVNSINHHLRHNSDRSESVCPVCNIDWKTAESLSEHVKSEAVPDPLFDTIEELEAKHVQNMKRARVHQRSSDSQRYAKRQRIECAHCKSVFQSRNKLFKHLKLECKKIGDSIDGNSSSFHQVSVADRIVLMIGYVGTKFFGSKFNGVENEEKRPTVEGTIMGAVQQVWDQQGQQLLKSPSLPQPSEAAVSVKVEASGADRTNTNNQTSTSKPNAIRDITVTVGACSGTERCAHCVCVVMTVSVKCMCSRNYYPTLMSKNMQSKRFQMLRTLLNAQGISLLVMPRNVVQSMSILDKGVTSEHIDGAASHHKGSQKSKKVKPIQKPFANMRRSVKRLTYKCAVPYVHLLSPEVFALCQSPKSEEAVCNIWFSGFPPVYDDDPDRLLSVLRSTVTGSDEVEIDLKIAKCGGNASVSISCPHLSGSEGATKANDWARRCTNSINGLQWPEKTFQDYKMIALPASEARIKMAVHKKLKKVLKRLSGVKAHVGSSKQKSSSKNPARSFRNFTSDKKNAKSALSAMQKSLMRCSSGLQDDIRGTLKSNRISSALIEDHGCPEDSWIFSEWLIISFSAVSFLPEQVRRMVGVIAAVMCGIESIDFIDTLFGDEPVETSICPAGAIWLDHIVLNQISENFCESMISEPKGTIRSRKSMRQEIISSIVHNMLNTEGFENMMKKAELNAHVRRSWIWWKKMGKPRWWLAPMVGASEPAFRLLVRENGVSIASTEMVDSGGYAFSEKYRTQFHVEDPRDRPLIVQLGGANPEHLRLAAIAAASKADAIELNIGCPQQCARKAKPSYGAFLMDRPNELVSIVNMLAGALKPFGIPLLCKIRCYVSTEATVELCKKLEMAGCSCLTVHGRTRFDKGGSGSTCRALADWSKIKAVKDALKIPVVGNGNVQCRGDAEAMIRECGVDGVMSGVGLLKNPQLFHESIDAEFFNQVSENSRRISIALRYLELCKKWPPYHVCLSKHVMKILGQDVLGKHPKIYSALQEFARYTRKEGRALTNIDQIVADLQAIKFA